MGFIPESHRDDGEPRRDVRERKTREAELKEPVQLGLEQLRQGESLELDDASLGAFFDEAKARARKRLARRKAQGQ